MVVVLLRLLIDRLYCAFCTRYILHVMVLVLFSVDWLDVQSTRRVYPPLRMDPENDPLDAMLSPLIPFK